MKDSETAARDVPVRGLPAWRPAPCRVTPSPPGGILADMSAEPSSPRRLEVSAVAAGVIAVAAASAVAHFLCRGAAGAPAWWPLVVLGASMGLVIALITLARVHAFVALVISAMAAGLMAAPGSLPGEGKVGHWVRALELTGESFGSVCGSIGIVIALASVIGVCLLESGAADRIVLRFLRAFGEKRAALALLAGTYVVSIPIFFDTIFMLLLPLARAMYRRTRRDYVLYVMAIACAAVVTHCTVIPHPGPLAMAEALRVDTGQSILLGLLVGLFPVAVGWLVISRINARMPVVPPETTDEAAGKALGEDRPMPPLWASLSPVLVPVALVSAASTAIALDRNHASSVTGWMLFLGNRNMALLIGAALAVALLLRQRGISLAGAGRLIAPALETAGVVILITAAGGALGLMLKHAGVGTAIKTVAAGASTNMVVLSYAVALVIRIAQGSSTVAMLTTASMMEPMLAGSPHHPLVLFVAIGYGALGCSWMNDSGFWLVSRLGGFTERQTLRSWTVLLTVLSVAGLVVALVLDRFIGLAAPR